MTRKDYVQLAGVVAKIEDMDTRTRVATGLCEGLKADNKTFDVVRFLRACHVITSKQPEPELVA